MHDKHNFHHPAGNECYGYNINSNTDPIRELWREYFAKYSSPISQFTNNFPATPGFDGTSFPVVERKADTNPELFHFRHNDIVFFGLNQVGRETYEDTHPVNDDWVTDRLGLDPGCTMRSIVIIAQRPPNKSVYDRFETYFNTACGGVQLPILTITGDMHPETYCQTMQHGPNRIDITVEAFSAGPLKISVVRDMTPGNNRADFFHVEDTQATPTNLKCPTELWGA